MYLGFLLFGGGDPYLEPPPASVFSVQRVMPFKWYAHVLTPSSHVRVWLGLSWFAPTSSLISFSPDCLSVRWRWGGFLWAVWDAALLFLLFFQRVSVWSFPLRDALAHCMIQYVILMSFVQTAASVCLIDFRDCVKSNTPLPPTAAALLDLQVMVAEGHTHTHTKLDEMSGTELYTHL